MLKHIIAIVFIFIVCSIAWAVLGASMGFRTDEKSDKGRGAVAELWGSEQAQVAPTVTIEWKEVHREEMTDKEKAAYARRKQHEEDLAAEREKRPARQVFVHEQELIKVEERDNKLSVELESSDVDVGLGLDYRQKGLLWFSTYKVAFDAQYKFRNPVDRFVAATVVFPFGSRQSVFDNMLLDVDGRADLNVSTEKGTLIGRFTLPPGAEQEFRVRYQSRGLDQWTYRFGADERIVKNFSLVMTTDFDDIDFPPSSISPDTKVQRSDGTGWKLAWRKQSLVSALMVGMVMPHKINPGPLAASMSLSAPVSLLFFFFMVFMLQCMRGVRLHPMNYFFLAASLFAFNLLFSYLVDHVDIVAAFAASAAVSIGLVAPYLRRVAGWRFAVVEAGLSQVLYQTVFSVAHFFAGYTGLTITIGAILTLAVVMHLTAKIDWTARFAGMPAAEPAKG
ncbi:MAG: inner membrane CreD family protein [Deltaproteobacteria bacterium]|nr:inner membrane CreD family protein [Deltaproteobacteria bacterium]